MKNYIKTKKSLNFDMLSCVFCPYFRYSDRVCDIIMIIISIVYRSGRVAKSKSTCPETKTFKSKFVDMIEFIISRFIDMITRFEIRIDARDLFCSLPKLFYL